MKKMENILLLFNEGFFHNQGVISVGSESDIPDSDAILFIGSHRHTFNLKHLNPYLKAIKSKPFTYSIICGNRKKRKDTFLKRLSSKIANKIRKLILKDDCNDTACALKVFRKQDYLKLEYFKNMHRFLPALFKMNGGKVFNVLIDDRERLAGISKFNFNNRFWIGIADLFRVWILIKQMY